MGYLPAVLLLVVAFLHATNVRRHALTPWKGGGFAMFSTIDSPSERVTRARLTGPRGLAGFAVVPESAREAERRFRTMPSPANAHRFATRLLETDWACAIEANAGDARARTPAAPRAAAPTPLCRERNPRAHGPRTQVHTVELTLFTTALAPGERAARSRLIHQSAHGTDAAPGNPS